MTDDEFRKTCDTFGFAPSRALRELIDSAITQAVLAEREACARVCEDLPMHGPDDETADWYGLAQIECADAIRARGLA